MFYERIREKNQTQEKESETEDIDEIFMNQSSEGTHQLTNNDDLNKSKGKQYENYLQKDNQNYINKVNIKNYLSPYLSKLNNDYTNNKNVNKDNNYVVSNRNETNYEKIIRKNETDINNYRTTEDNTKSFNYQQNETETKYDSKNKKNNPIANDNKDKKIRRLNFSYTENENNFDNYNQIRNIKDKKDLVKYEYNNNNTFNQKLETENNTNSKNLKLGYKINNDKQDMNKNTNYYSQTNLNNIGENKLENEDKLIVKKYQKKVVNADINSNMKNEKEMTLLKQEVKNINYIKNTQKTDNEEKSIRQPNYYFSYDYSIKIKNYDKNNSDKSELSTAINTAKYKNYPDNQNKEIKIKEFNIVEETNQNENKNYKTQYIANNKTDYALNQKEQNYINNLKVLKSDLNKENPKSNSIIQIYEDKNNINNNINNKKDLSQKLKYYNSTNNLIINEMKEIEKETIKEKQKITDNSDISSLLKKEYTNIKIISDPQENIIINNRNSKEKYNYTNLPEYQKQLVLNNIPKKKEIEIPYFINNNMPMIQEKNNLNTFESAVIRNMDEEEEIRTLELEKERQKLAELEKEKEKLINEERERRDRIMKEIQRQEEQYLERKKYMRKKYDEKLRKKREDEEKLIKIKEEQRKQLEEINELKNNRKYDEQKLLMLTEGKFNKRQRNDYMIGISNKTLNLNKFPFRINIDENNNDYLINKMKNNNIDRNYKYWNYKNNLIEIGDRNSIDNSIENDENDNDDNYEENIIKDNLDFEEIENNSDEIEENKFKSINEFDRISEDKKQKTDRDNDNNDIFNFNNIEKEKKSIYRPKNRRMNINNNNNVEFKTFSPKITLKTKLNNFSPLIEKDINKISTELPEISKENLLEENHKNKEEKKEINENVYKIDNKIVMDKDQKLNDSNDKEYYEKKKFSFNRRKDNKENNIKTKYSGSKKGSFDKLNELREITSKLASEVEKKIELINKNKLISKTKSSQMFAQTYTQFDYKNFKINLDSDNNKNDEININKEIIQKDKDKDNDKEKEKEKSKIYKSNKYNQLIKETKIEISNIINNNHNQSSKTKSLIGEKVLPEEIKKECITELKKMETITKRKGKENIQSNTDKVNKILDNINRNKNIGTLKTYKTANNFNQKMFYNEYLYGNKKKIKGQEIDQKFLPYYKEIYGEATPEKDV